MPSRCKPPGGGLAPRRAHGGGGRPLDPGAGGLDALAASSYLQRRWSSTLYAVVLYTALWCPHSRQMRPVFERLAFNESQHHPAALSYGIIDCAGEDAPACHDACPLGYPSVRLLRQGKELAEYTGEPNDAALLQWVQTQTQAAERVAAARAVGEASSQPQSHAAPPAAAGDPSRQLGFLRGVAGAGPTGSSVEARRQAAVALWS